MENRNELFRAIPIFDSELKDDEIRDFTVNHKEGTNLVKYLAGFAENDEEKHNMRTYLVRDNNTDELIGYFSLKAGMISVNEQKIGDSDSFDTRPGVELANFAINSSYIKKHDYMKGVGKVIFHRLIKSIIHEAADKIGIRYIYIFALPFDSLMKRYEDYGFKRLSSKQEEALHTRLKPNYDQNCIFMYQEL